MAETAERLAGHMEEIMKTKRSRALMESMGVTLAFSLALVVGVALTGSADGAVADSDQPETEEPVSAHDAESGLPPTASASDAAPSPDEGIKVHGHWTIEVRDPDGTLVEHREFDNALLGTGFLELVLARTKTVGGWQISAFSVSPDEVCEEPAGTPHTECLIEEATDTSPGNNVFKTLVVSFTTGVNLTLAASLIAQRDGIVSSVQTRYRTCASSVAPDNCPGGVPTGSSVFTRTTLSPAVAVSTGQQVQVSVVFTFS